MEFYSGVYTVIPTFFKDTEIDIEQLNKNINYQINCGIKNIVILGTTSETPTLSEYEENLIVKTTWENYNEKVNIIVGIGGNNTKKTIENGYKFQNHCHAFMVTVPYYNKPTQEGIYQHFASIAQLLDKPIMMYNIPSRCGVSMSPQIIANLYNSFSNIKAIKEASGSITQTLEIKNLCDIVILSGDDALTLPLMSVGAIGVVSVTSNILPKLMLLLVELFNKSENQKASELNKKMYPIFKSLFLETNPVPLKYIMMKCNLAKSDIVRLPLVTIQSQETKDKLDNLITDITFINNELGLSD
jgi:4-hydroxy-tetrahydrodipicolinate synthase